MSDLDPISGPVTAFSGDRLLASGPRYSVALAVKAESDTGRPILVFDDLTGKVVDFDLRGSREDVLRRLEENDRGRDSVETETPRPARGRPKLGVVAREVTLLPRHWDWLGAQPGGASQILRQLVDAARSADDGKTERRAATEAAYRFMSAMAGDLPGFEEASRALFSADEPRFRSETTSWPADIRDHALRMARRGG